MGRRAVRSPKQWKRLRRSLALQDLLEMVRTDIRDGFRSLSVADASFEKQAAGWIGSDAALDRLEDKLAALAVDPEEGAEEPQEPKETDDE